MTMTKTTTSKPRFGLADVLTAMRKIVKREGEGYVYDNDRGSEDKGCYYATTNNAPSCLIGHVIYALDPEQFIAIAIREDERNESTQALDLTRDGWIPRDFWSPDAESAAQEAQRVQDLGQTWGEALSVAEDIGADAD